MNNTIRNFTDLNTWKEAHQLALLVYKTTVNFPEQEKFGIVSQMRRSAVSITSNIAEGFGRNTRRDKIQFYTITRGSILELQSQSLLSFDLGYTNKNEFDALIRQITIVSKLLSGLVKSAGENSRL